MGATLVPTTFLTVDEMTKSLNAALFSSLLVLFGTYRTIFIQFSTCCLFRCRPDNSKPVHITGPTFVGFYDGLSFGSR